MAGWSGTGKLLLVAGGLLALTGLLLMLADRIPGIGHFFSWFGKLPGDIAIKRDHFSLYFPLGTSVVISVVLSLLFYLLSWVFRR